MKRLTGGVATIGIPTVAFSGLLFGSGCEPHFSVNEGSPLLERFELPELGDPVSRMAIDLLHPTSTGVPPSVPPTVTFRAVFDRLLDADNLESYDVDARRWIPTPAVATATSADGVAITLTSVYQPGGAIFPSTDPPGPYIGFSGAPTMVTPPVPSQLFGGKERPVTFIPGPSLPAGSGVVTIKLDTTKITGQASEPMVGADTFTVPPTDPFRASIGLPKPDAKGVTPPQLPTFVLKVTFNNAIGQAAIDSIKVADDKGKDIPVGVKLDANQTGLPSSVVVVEMKRPDATSDTPPWPAGATLTVTVGADAADIYGSKLVAERTGKFMIQAADAPDGGSGG